jgi:hypothetical protein
MQVPPSQPKHRKGDANRDPNGQRKCLDSVQVLGGLSESDQAARDDAQHARNVAW